MSLTVRQRETLLQDLRQVLSRNHTGHFTKPAPHLYPHQWNWDSGFIALGYASYAPELAMAELRALFEGQWQNGMLPHIVFRSRRDDQAVYFPGPDFWQTQDLPHGPVGIQTSGITQPPVHGMVLRRLAEHGQASPELKTFLQEMWPRVVALHHYYYRDRNPEGNGLIVIRHPWEAGTDNAPPWDVALARFDPAAVAIPPYQRLDLVHGKAEHRPTQHDYDYYIHLVDLFRRCGYDEAEMQRLSPFCMQDPLFNAVLLRSNDDLIALGEQLGQDVSQLAVYSQQTRHSIDALLWHEESGLYHVRNLSTGERLPHRIASGFMPLFAGVPGPERSRRLLETLKSPAFAGTAEQPASWLPTYDLTALDCQPRKYWRGPIWINLNWMLYHGLRRYGYHAEADQLRDASLQLVQQHGCHEYFYPYADAAEPRGLGTDAFSWTAALVMDWLQES